MAHKRATDRDYPPDKPPAAKRRAVLREFVRYAMGDPALSVWEAAFVHSMKRLADLKGGPLPSAKQKIIVQQIYDKLRAIELAPDTDADDDPDLDPDPDAERAAQQGAHGRTDDDAVLILNDHRQPADSR